LLGLALTFWAELSDPLETAKKVIAARVARRRAIQILLHVIPAVALCTGVSLVAMIDRS
jgi:hypothetical protein